MRQVFIDGKLQSATNAKIARVFMSRSTVILAFCRYSVCINYRQSTKFFFAFAKKAHMLQNTNMYPWFRFFFLI